MDRDGQFRSSDDTRLHQQLQILADTKHHLKFEKMPLFMQVTVATCNVVLSQQYSC